MVFGSDGRTLRSNLSTSNDKSYDEFKEEDDDRDRPRLPQSLKQSYAILDALSDKDSKLARFLFVGKNGWESRHDTAQNDGVCNNNSDDETMSSMGDSHAFFLALALEPTDIRNERIIQLFQAYAIFGALFMNGVWILYEWGSWKGYGGDDTNLNAARVFEFVMAIALCSNIFLALYGAWFWIVSILWNSSHQDFVFESGKALIYLQYLLMFTIQFLSVGLLLGIYCNLSPHLPETIVAMSIAITIYLVGGNISMSYQLACAPLECYHYPSWTRILFPRVWLSRKGRERLKARAKFRAQELRKRAYRERKKLDPGFSARSRNASTSSVVGLLRTAASNLGRIDNDISTYEARLEKDWFNEVHQLKNRSVECLSRYMPLRLAEEVHKLLLEVESDTATTDCSVKMKSIGE
mmetsp:Transcript_19309/g.41922  ORF Transcript_19309/g.41922 Transcript_19309/m.41922 type:complete len:409 (-) Transcript_19309:184-1410(-)